MLGPLLRKWSRLLAPGLLRRLSYLYGPFLGSAIRVTELRPDFRYVRVEMPLTFYNRNYVGTQFGGSIYAMTDPFYMMMLMQNLGNEYIVWDRAAKIDFLKPGRHRLIVEFRLDEDELAEVRRRTAGGEKFLYDKEVLIHDVEGLLVAKVIKTLYVRLKGSGLEKEAPVNL